MENHIDALIQKTKDPHSDVRRKSAIILGTSHIISSQKEVIQALLSLLGDEVIAVREAAEEALLTVGGQAVVTALLPCLQDPSTTVVNYTVEILSQVGYADIDQILALLESKDHDVRKFGCDILGNLQYKESVYDLIELLNDPHINVAIAAGEALGKLGSPEAVPHLVKALQHTDTWMKCIAAEALGKIGDKQAVDPFIAMSDYEDPIVLYTVIKAMGNLDDERTLPYILSVLRSNPLFASSASQAIENLATLKGNSVYEEVIQAGVGEYFIRLLNSENLEVLKSVIHLIGRLQLKEAVHPLGHLLEHKQTQIVKEATTALVQIGEPGLEEIHAVFEQKFAFLQPDALEYIEEPPAPFTKIPIIRVLGQIGSNRSISLLIRALDEKVADEIRVEAAAALGKILYNAVGRRPKREQPDKLDPLVPSAITHLIAVLSDSCEALRVTAAEALGDIGISEAFESLFKLLHDQSLEVREASSIAITKIQGMSLNEKLGRLHQLLETAFPLSDAVRASLIQTLARIAQEQEADILIKSLHDPSYEVRTVAVEAIRSFSPDGPYSSRLHTLILPLLHDANFQVRIAVIQFLVDWGMRQQSFQEKAELETLIFDSLLPMLSDTHPRVRYETCQELARFVPTLYLKKETQTLLIDRLLHLVDEQEIMVKIAAVEALTALKTFIMPATSIIPVFRNMLEQTQDVELKEALQKALSVF